MLNDIKLSLQYILPKLWLTRLAGWGAGKRGGWLTKLVIDLFVKYYKVNMQEALKPNTDSYRTFNDFFIRPLRDDIRPVNTNPGVLTMPADGAISQLGRIDNDKILQAKGHSYTLEALLAGNYQLADQFRNGLFVTTYLSPRDYHRVHMPCNGILREMIYVPGDLFSVNHLTAQNVPNLFARNERVICRFDTEFGPMIQILVGATIVGSIETVWSGTVTPPREGIIKRWTWPEGSSDGAVALLKGQEMGRFKLGSTVINLFTPGKVKLVEHLQNLSVTRIGEPLAISTDMVVADEVATATSANAGVAPADEKPVSTAKTDATSSAVATTVASTNADAASTSEKPVSTAKTDVASTAAVTPAAATNTHVAPANEKPVSTAKTGTTSATAATPAAPTNADAAPSGEKSASTVKPGTASSAPATPAASTNTDAAPSGEKPVSTAKSGVASLATTKPENVDAGRKATPPGDDTKDKS